MATKVLILLGTKKGAFILESDAERRSWALRGPFCETWPMNHVIAARGYGTIYAGGGDAWFGPVVETKDLGRPGLTPARVSLTRPGKTRSRRCGACRPPRPACTPASSRPGCSEAMTTARRGGTSPACASTPRARTGSRAAAG